VALNLVPMCGVLGVLMQMASRTGVIEIKLIRLASAAAEVAAA
jgi:hypothetical protein